jgi:RNA polymerase sigma-70 factor (ECF subfamily)
VVGDESDLTLVERIARGDRDAFARLYDRHAPALLALGRRILGELREAEDVLHDVFLEAWRSIGDFDARRGTVRAWLSLRMRSRAIDRLRGIQRAPLVALDPMHLDRAAPTAGDPQLAPDLRRVREALTTLSSEQRVVIELAYFTGLSFSEIAARLGIPLGTAKSRAAAAMSRLRTALWRPHLLRVPAVFDGERALAMQAAR